ncbi:MAG: hypothetical protein VW963_11080 [Candidatus Neomarinimicrobiota bacterium]|jgi:hypothetical protein|uniref:Uncharacterized protein n=1 Tax=SAR86 cluster bacterium TaxID=2030880 RepID=A0A368BVM6_9GAMM|nr:MAG: hypothetical protein DBW96_02900 [SAR86 cluster bacterium]|tara:strand:- start:97 stop:330 length:234 start_codon:yes stop_codon:yes gene_type:complete
MNQTEKTAFRESIIVVLMGLVINFPLQTFLLWLTIDIWDWRNTIMISIFTQLIITFVALIRVYSIRMRFVRGTKKKS